MEGYKLFNLNNDIKFDTDNILINKISFNNNIKYNIYYLEPNIPNEIYLRLPRLRLLYDLKVNKYNDIIIPINPLWDKTSKFIDFIKNLELQLYNRFIKKKEWKSIIIKDNNMNFIKLKINNNIKLSSMNKTITMNDLKSSGQVDIVIKLKYIWTKDKKMGLSTMVYQITYIPSPELNNIDFIDSPMDTILVKPSINSIPPPPPPPIQPIIKQNSSNISNISFVPSKNDLLNALTKLKH